MPTGRKVNPTMISNPTNDRTTAEAPARPVPRIAPRARLISAPPALRDERREFICTEDAAYHLGRSPQTLRLWGCKGSGLLTPMRIGRRLAWRVSDIRRLLGIEA